MPNWCSNSVTFYYRDHAQIERMKEAFLAERLFSEFVPNPAGPDSEDWYTHNLAAWGTKWDTGGSDISALTLDSITLVFDTAWSPPLAFYAALEEQGWEVEGSYYEPGMAFVGSYSTEAGDNCYDIPETLQEFLATVPQELDETWAISENWPEDDWDDL